MSKKVNEFAGRAERVIECTEQVRTALLGFKRAVARQSKLIGSGTPAVTALEDVNAAGIRQNLTDALAEFEALRYQMRVACIAVALDDGASLSDVARALGVSRQLVSRIAADITSGASG